MKLHSICFVRCSSCDKHFPKQRENNNNNANYVRNDWLNTKYSLLMMRNQKWRKNKLARQIIITYIIELELGKVKAGVYQWNFVSFDYVRNAYISRTHAISLDLVSHSKYYTAVAQYALSQLMINLSCIFQAIVKIWFEIGQMNDYHDYALSTEQWALAHTHIPTV